MTRPGGELIQLPAAVRRRSSASRVDEVVLETGDRHTRLGIQLRSFGMRQGRFTQTDSCFFTVWYTREIDFESTARPRGPFEKMANGFLLRRELEIALPAQSDARGLVKCQSDLAEPRPLLGSRI